MRQERISRQIEEVTKKGCGPWTPQPLGIHGRDGRAGTRDPLVRAKEKTRRPCAGRDGAVLPDGRARESGPAIHLAARSLVRAVPVAFVALAAGIRHHVGVGAARGRDHVPAHLGRDDIEGVGRLVALDERALSGRV